ncbi:hypothetical protein C8R43DRAFT_942414 [Mycena crocata]|nr:hypothetical protein C8R43DRAFT_942414 [Mycena crocata]
MIKPSKEGGRWQRANGTRRRSPLRKQAPKGNDVTADHNTRDTYRKGDMPIVLKVQDCPGCKKSTVKPGPRSGRVLLTNAALTLKPFNLSLSDLQLLQSSKRCFVSGSILKGLLFDGAKGNRLEIFPCTTTPLTLDIYCARAEGHKVASFLCEATGRTFTTSAGNLNTADGINRRFELSNLDAPKIQVFETSSDNPLDVVFRFPTTADMGVWLLDKIWHAYPDISFQGLAISTPERLPVHNRDARQRAWDIIQTHFRYGFWINTYLTRSHRCGSDPSCPLSCRSTEDSACLIIRFPVRPWTSSFNDNPWKFRPHVGWSLGAASFCKNWHVGKQSSSTSFMKHEPELIPDAPTDDEWNDKFEVLMTKISTPT